MRLKLLKITLLLFGICWNLALFANPETNEPFEKPAGEPLRIEYLMLIAVIAFVLFKIFGIGKKPPAPTMVATGAPRPKAKPMMQQVSETIGGLEEVGKGTYVGGKMVSESRDVQTYLMLAQVDRAAIRKEERAKAEAAVAKYEKKLFYMKVTIGVLALLFIIFTHRTFINWFYAIKEFVSSYIS
ncbi:MAG: hypothetical protein ACI85I_001063 [Arenicella sp.]|jgi:hypothetical protein